MPVSKLAELYNRMIKSDGQIREVWRLALNYEIALHTPKVESPGEWGILERILWDPVHIRDPPAMTYINPDTL